MNRAATRRSTFTKPAAPASHAAATVPASRFSTSSSVSMAKSITTTSKAFSSQSSMALSSHRIRPTVASYTSVRRDMSTTRLNKVVQSIPQQSLKSHSLPQMTNVLSVQVREMSLYNRIPKLQKHSDGVINELRDSQLDYHSLPKKQGKTAQDYISEVPPIVVYEDIAICDGDVQAGAGHPREFIQLNKSRPGEPEPCKYCGLRFIKADENQVPLEQ